METLSLHISWSPVSLLSAVACAGALDADLLLVLNDSQPVAGESWVSALLVSSSVADRESGGLGGLEEDVVVENVLVGVLASFDKGQGLDLAVAGEEPPDLLVGDACQETEDLDVLAGLGVLLFVLLLLGGLYVAHHAAGELLTNPYWLVDGVELLLVLLDTLLDSFVQNDGDLVRTEELVVGLLDGAPGVLFPLKQNVAHLAGLAGVVSFRSTGSGGKDSTVLREQVLEIARADFG